MGELLLQVENLCKDYELGPQVIRAVHNVSVSVEHGEFVAVMGPSGSGKSTFMNVVGCLDTPTSGRYVLDGTDISVLSRDQLARTRNSRIGFVFQDFNLLRRTTALQNVELPLAYSRYPRKERRVKAEQVLSSVGLSDRAHHGTTQLSGGQRQRVAIARALVNGPSLILADEPTGALDTRTGTEIMALFQRLNREGITIVLVTHEPEIAQFARRILRFRDGSLVSDETVPDPADAEELMSRKPQGG